MATALILAAGTNGNAAELDLTSAVIHLPAAATPLEKRAATLLTDEVARRSWVRWQIGTAPAPASPSIDIRRGKGPAEGYRLKAQNVNGRAVVTISGNDARGVLYGVGGLLRALQIAREKVVLPGELDIVTAPRLALRGHQLGYRPKTNSYDGWNVAMWEQYIRDLAVFGTNAIELIPPRSDDDPDSPHFPLPPAQMMREMSRLAGEYGMDVWVWFPAMERDNSDPQTIQKELAAWSKVIDSLPRVDAIFVPGGDPGNTPPKVLLAFLEKQAAKLRIRHPKLQMWMSPQGFDQARMEEFYALVEKQPRWLTGIVHGPQVRDSLATLRKRLPPRYPIRNYPDITHSLHCQFPVPNWDPAFAITLGRETINPRPLDQAAIFRATYRDTIGFISYSEGCNDDFNKFMWSSLAWNPDAAPAEIVRDYSRYFIGASHTEAFGQGLLLLEKNWRKPLASSEQVSRTLEHFQGLAASASPQDWTNWRFQQAMYRANYDAYVRGRLLFENALEARALEALSRAEQLGALNAVEQAQRTLAEPNPDPQLAALRARVFELAEALFQSIRMQLSVPRYRAIEMSRGANLDAIDMPLNNRRWLATQFDSIRQLKTEPERLKAIEAIVHWTDAGPGGFYDDLGDMAHSPHLVLGSNFQDDPTFSATPVNGVGDDEGPDLDWRKSTWTYAEGMRDVPLELRYTGLNREATYKVRVIYAGEHRRMAMRLVANDKFEIHPFRRKDVPPRPVEFEIPKAATADGTLSLKWFGTPGLGGNGRGNQVAEVWLIQQTNVSGKTR